jgi:tRNA 2-thiocytidine biosynthesis protein TtcA
MLADWEKRFPGRVENTFNALARIVPSHMMDGTLFDFTGLRPAGVPRADGDIAFDEEACAAAAPLPADPTVGAIRFAEAD